MPVTTPLEFVWVRYCSFALEATGVDVEEDWAETAAAKAAAMRTEYCILVVVERSFVY